GEVHADDLHVVGGQAQNFQPFVDVQVRDGAGAGGDDRVLDGLGAAEHFGVGGVGAGRLCDGGIGADQGVQTALGVADVGDAVRAVDGQGVAGGGAQGAGIPLIRS